MNKKVVHFCENNFGFGTDDLVSNLADEEFEVEVDPCMGHCGECAEGPIAVINDELITADSIDELHNKIIEAVENSEE
ncbi:MAG: hypothetical protein PWP27_1880 [Clostridiales bacterium]|nr:hypothetical protein [Clostridiales bacterium]